MKQAVGVCTDGELAKYLGFTGSGSISTWKARDKIPYAECDKVSQNERVSIDWLLNGGQLHNQPPMSGGEGLHEIDSDAIPLTYFNVQASAGYGTFVENEDQKNSLLFKKDWINKKGFKAEKLCLLDVVGDSMEPTLHDQDLIMLDMEAKALKNGVYVIQYEGALLVKRVQRQINNSILIKSDNPLYEPEVLSPDLEHNIRVIGEVVWFSRSVK